MLGTGPRDREAWFKTRRCLLCRSRPNPADFAIEDPEGRLAGIFRFDLGITAVEAFVCLPCSDTYGDDLTNIIAAQLQEDIEKANGGPPPERGH